MLHKQETDVQNQKADFESMTAKRVVKEYENAKLQLEESFRKERSELEKISREERRESNNETRAEIEKDRRLIVNELGITRDAIVAAISSIPTALNNNSQHVKHSETNPNNTESETRKYSLSSSSKLPDIKTLVLDNKKQENSIATITNEYIDDFDVPKESVEILNASQKVLSKSDGPDILDDFDEPEMSHLTKTKSDEAEIIEEDFESFSSDPNHDKNDQKNETEISDIIITESEIIEEDFEPLSSDSTHERNNQKSERVLSDLILTKSAESEINEKNVDSVDKDRYNHKKNNFFRPSISSIKPSEKDKSAISLHNNSDISSDSTALPVEINLPNIEAFLKKVSHCLKNRLNF